MSFARAIDPQYEITRAAIVYLPKHPVHRKTAIEAITRIAASKKFPVVKTIGIPNSETLFALCAERCLGNEGTRAVRVRLLGPCAQVGDLCQTSLVRADALKRVAQHDVGFHDHVDRCSQI